MDKPLQTVHALADRVVHLTTHLTDHEANTILSTHPNPSSRVLSSLSSAYIQAHETASRMGLGDPLRLTVSTLRSDLVVIQSTPSWPPPSTALNVNTKLDLNRIDESESTGLPDDTRLISDSSTMVVGSVIASLNHLAEARVAMWAMEDVSRRLQTRIGP